MGNYLKMNYANSLKLLAGKRIRIRTAIVADSAINGTTVNRFLMIFFTFEFMKKSTLLQHIPRHTVKVKLRELQVASTTACERGIAHHILEQL